MKVITQKGITNVIFETDSKSVVDATHLLRSGSSEYSLLINHVISFLRCNPNFKVKFIRRQANTVTHVLARTAISWARRHTFETLPTCITAILNNEMIQAFVCKKNI
jgi:ribonuclease HI